MSTVSLGLYLKVNQKYWREGYLLNKELGLYNDKNDFIKQRTDYIISQLLKYQNFVFSGTIEQARAFIIAALTKKLKGLS